MGFTYGQWLCHDCSKRFSDSGYGCESKDTAETNYDKTLLCEQCNKMVWSLYRFRIPEKNITFHFKVGYRCWTTFLVKIDGITVMRDEGRDYKQFEFTADVNYMHSLELAQKEQLNYHTEEDLAGFAAYGNTIKWENSEELISDDIFDAFKIYHNFQPVRRIRYLHDGFSHENGEYHVINGRVEYY